MSTKHSDPTSSSLASPLHLPKPLDPRPFTSAAFLSNLFQISPPLAQSGALRKTRPPADLPFAFPLFVLKFNFPEELVCPAPDFPKRSPPGPGLFSFSPCFFFFL